MVCLLEEISEPWEVSMQQKCSRGAHHGKGKVPLVSLCREAAPCSSAVFRGKEHTAGPTSSVHLANIISEGDLMICQSGKRVLQFILATLPSRIMWLRFDFYLFIFFWGGKRQNQSLPSSPTLVLFTVGFTMGASTSIFTLFFKTKIGRRISECRGSYSSSLKKIRDFVIFFTLLCSCKPQQHFNSVKWEMVTSDLVLLDTFSLSSGWTWLPCHSGMSCWFFGCKI